MKTKNIYYNFNQDSYQKAKDLYQTKIDLQDMIKREYEIIGIKNKPHTFTMDELEIQGQQSYKDFNPMELSLQKLFEMKEIDYDTVTSLLEEYKAIRTLKQPTKQQFHAVAATTRQKERLLQINNLIKAVEAVDYAVNPHDVLKAFRSCLWVKNGKLVVDQNWVNLL